MTSRLSRLLREFEEIIKDPPYNATAGPISDEDFTKWKAYLAGPVDTPYHGGLFELEIEFPENYPYLPPIIIFKTKIYHCNINHSGHICLDVLNENWSPALNISKILMSISVLLSQQNPADPLEPEIAKLYSENYENFCNIAKFWTEAYASVDLKAN